LLSLQSGLSFATAMLARKRRTAGLEISTASSDKKSRRTGEDGTEMRRDENRSSLFGLDTHVLGGGIFHGTEPDSTSFPPSSRGATGPRLSTRVQSDASAGGHSRAQHIHNLGEGMVASPSSILKRDGSECPNCLSKGSRANGTCEICGSVDLLHHSSRTASTYSSQRRTSAYGAQSKNIQSPGVNCSKCVCVESTTAYSPGVSSCRLCGYDVDAEATDGTVPFDHSKHGDIAFALSGIQIRSPHGGSREVVVPLMISPPKGSSNIFHHDSLQYGNSDVLPDGKWC